MAPSGNVISFEDAKRIASSKSAGRPSVKTSKKTQSTEKSREQAKAASRPSAKSASKAVSRKSASAASSKSQKPSAQAKRSVRTPAERTAARPASKGRSASVQDARRTSSSRSAVQRQAPAKMPAWMSEPPADEERLAEYAISTRNGSEEEERAEEEAASRSEQRRRKRAKEKASRQFLRQFGSDEGASGETGTRAAVYKAEMGKEHKRAFEQMGGAARSGAAKVAGGVSRRAMEPGRMGAPRFVVWGSIAMCLLAVCVFVYPAAQQYYIELRNHDRLQAEYDAVAARNDAIQGDVDYLGTDEGMEDAARSELGWVHEGEQTVTVAGLPEETEQESSNEKVRKQVVSGTVPAPQTWYSVILDPFFGYESGTQVKIS